MKFVFFKSKEHQGYYFIYLTTNGNNIERMFQKWTHIGEFENSGYGKMEIERGPEFTSEHGEDFLDFLAAKIATNHIPSYYNARNYRAYYEFKGLDFEVWEKQFEEHYKELKKNMVSEMSNKGVQTTFNF